MPSLSEHSSPAHTHQSTSVKHSHTHSEHHQMMIHDFRRRFRISVLISLPILLLSPMIQELLEFSIRFPGDQYVLLGLSSLIYFYGGWPFLTGLVSELHNRQPGMMTLISVAISVAFGYSVATTLGLDGKTFFWELATLIDIMLLGHWIEMKSVLKASDSLQKLADMMPTEANRLHHGKTQKVSIDQLNKGDQVLVHPGEKVPVDGKIIDGVSTLNEAMVTGESKPVKKSTGDSVIGGTLNGNGSITIRVEQLGEDAYLSKVIRMVEQAQSEKSKTQNLADRIAYWLTLTALTVGFSTLFTWLILGNPFVFALERMVSVMVITCPHALGLAVPLVVAISTSSSAQRGLLIRNRSAFEDARKVTTVVFDKTGTLTLGNFGVTHVISLDRRFSDQQILSMAASLEAHSEHPLAQGILQKAETENIEIQMVQDFKAMTGTGIRAQLGKHQIKIVGAGYLLAHDFHLPETAVNDTEATLVYLLVDDKLAGYITLADEIRPESYEAVQSLQALGLKVYMMTGDNESVSQSVAQKLGLDDYYANLLPEHKCEKIRQLQHQGEIVAMAGDGINDAPALATAEVGIAIGSGTDVAAETADIILVNSNPKDIVYLIRAGRKTYRKMIQNFVWASGYNVVAIPLATGIFLPWGWVINPAMGAVLMSLSTVIVAINAQLLKHTLRH